MSDKPTTTDAKSGLIRNPDGTISATVTITITGEQWSKFHHSYYIRAMSCDIGLDTPQVKDYVMFQIFKQAFPKAKPEMKKANAEPSEKRLRLFEIGKGER
jgi:hypothetical protein